MCNDMNRHEAELNEVDLTTVSGGFGPYPTADATCRQCHRCSSCGHHQDLAYYLRDHGNESVNSPLDCPYYNS